MSESSTRLEVRSGALWLTLSRPEKLNAIDGPTEQALRASLADLERRDDVRALVIRATGRYFSAGFDLAGRVAEMTRLSGAEYRREYRGMHEILAWWDQCILTPHVDRVFPLESAAEAHAWLESRKSKGKVLLQCAGAAQ